ncbi:MAG: ABC transporter ATP-binding protein [Actinomycetia bacterium]|nr:ABC transporter ATP-binding protein [Actinomycetes bacterium]
MSTLSGYAAPHTATAVAATALVKEYGSGDAAVRALDGIDLAIEDGRFTAIMGPSGSGKSTLMHCLAGLDQPSAGDVNVAGVELADLSDNALTDFRRERVGFVFQAFNLLPMLTARQNILLPLDLAGGEPDWAWFEEVVEVLGLSDRLGHRPAQLSGGQQQRVAVARAVLSRPAVIFADEPTGNLDRRSSAEVLAFLRRSVRELGQTVVMVTHDPVAAAHSDRVVLMADGRVAGAIESPDQDSILVALRDLGE